MTLNDEEGHDFEEEGRRPLPLVLLGGLYLFFFLLTMSTFGHPFPFLGTVFTGRPAEALVFVDSMICLYLFLGIMKNQRLTWYLLLAYNGFEIANTLTNLFLISPADIEKLAGRPVDSHALLVNNISVAAAVFLLTLFVYRHRGLFTNRSNYLF